MDEAKKSLFGINGVLADCDCRRCRRLKKKGTFKGLQFGVLPPEPPSHCEVAGCGNLLPRDPIQYEGKYVCRDCFDEWSSY